MQATLSFNEKAKKAIEPINFVTGGINAEGHTLVYKMHKYFARRPQNVFRWLIEHYSQPGDIILDCFCGGGVSLFEGLSVGRKVVVSDLNPLATFISECQITKISRQEYQKVMDEIREKVYSVTKPLFSTECRDCQESVDVRWFELAYLVNCEHCNNATLLSNDQKEQRGEKVVNGWYRCSHCKELLSSSKLPRVGYKLLSTTYRCRDCNQQKTVEPSKQDIQLLASFESQFNDSITEYGLWYPEADIPLNWDRQFEDGLQKKGIDKFSDLFTKRLLFSNALLLKTIKEYKEKVSSEIYQMLLFTFSAVIRHTNNMTISTKAWMDGRPVSWAKHAFWISSQFVEVNPIEYIEKRSKAIDSGLKYQQTQLGSVKRTFDFSDLQKNQATHMIFNQSSANLPLPSESIDLVITDPPYGSNVQYSELSSFWLVWLKDEFSIPEDFLSSKDEVVVHRKKKKPEYFKSYEDYFTGLSKVFSECYRLLKPGGALVFTFNNKDIQAWYSVISAAIKAGFYLDTKGVIYQEPIENYKNTAHARFEGAMQGDFIYTFVKLTENDNVDNKHIITKNSNGISSSDIAKFVSKTVEQILKVKGRQPTAQIYVEVYPKLIPIFVRLAETEEDFATINETWDITNFEQVLKNNFDYDKQTRTWNLMLT